VVFGQDPNPASPTEVIFARKTLMNSIAANMYPIDGMLETGKIDLVTGRANAESISAMLMAFPHLFPNSTNLWFANAKRDPATDTLADAAIWKAGPSSTKKLWPRQSMRSMQAARKIYWISGNQ
jgi:hypothetical protein